MGFRELLKEKEFIILDGATGTMIQKSGVQYDEVPDSTIFFLQNAGFFFSNFKAYL